METIKVICTAPWIYDGKRYERGDVLEIPKSMHDSMVKKFGACFDYPTKKKADE